MSCSDKFRRIEHREGEYFHEKSVFNRIIGDGHLELLFASFMEDCNDIISYAKNYLAVHFKLDYVDEEGFKKYKPTSFRQLLDGLTEYKEKV